jgi:hypothetical protein
VDYSCLSEAEAYKHLLEKCRFGYCSVPNFAHEALVKPTVNNAKIMRLSQ